MTKQITMSKLEYERIHKTLNEIRDISSLHPRTLEEARSNLESIKGLTFKVYELMRVCP